MELDDDARKVWRPHGPEPKWTLVAGVYPIECVVSVLLHWVATGDPSGYSQDNLLEDIIAGDKSII